MYNIYIVYINRNTHNYGGAEWVIDGENGRYTYPATMHEEDARNMYSRGECFDCEGQQAEE